MNHNQEAEVTVVGVSGSLRPGSLSAQALSLILQGANETGVRTEQIDLRDYELPFCDGGDDLAQRYPDLKELQELFRNAQGIILSTPEYHGSYSGVIKNLLDLLHGDEFSGKVVGLAGVSGGMLGGAIALEHLRAICRSLHAFVVPHQVLVPQSYLAFDATGAVQDPQIETRLIRLGREVAKYVKAQNQMLAHTHPVA